VLLGLSDVDQRIILVVVVLASFLTPFASSSFNIALPSIATEFGLDAVSMSWANLSYLLACAMFIVPFGRLADIFGRRKVFLGGNAAFAVSSLLLGVYPSAQTIVALRVLQGIASAMLFGTGVAILVSSTPPSRKGTTLGIYSASVYLGLSTGPFLGGLLIEMFGWRSILLITAGLGTVATIMVITLLKGEWRESEGESFDLKGSAIYSLSLLALMYGFSLLPSLDSLIPIIIGVVGFVAFLFVERKTSHPVLDIQLFAMNRVFTSSNIATLINYSATYAVTFLMSAYLQYVRGVSPETAGLLLMATPIVQAVFSPFSGRLSDRMEARKVAAIGMGITVLGLAPFTLLADSTDLIIIVGSLAVLGLGLAVFVTPNTNVIMSSVDKRLYGVASSTLATMRLSGQMLSMAVTLIIFSLLIGRLEITPEVYPALLSAIRVAFSVFSGLCIIGIMASLVSNRKQSVA
jgi:EmrB/QacA subfamily drug resistance transporter